MDMNERLVARIWHTEVAAEQAEAYERFAREVSLPMFRQQQGFAGVLMLRSGTACQVITLWLSLKDIAALDNSASYKTTVARISEQGFLQGQNTVELFEAHLLNLV
jgi:heme-degrading monooxygenase HmoA